MYFRPLKVLIACEESQRTCTEFRKLGHEAYSCDIQSCSGGHPEWHIKGDVLPLLNGNCTFTDELGGGHKIVGEWDLIIAHPPCTYLTNCATRAFSLRVTPAEKVVERWENRCKGAIFFMYFPLAHCKYIAVENPVGFMSKGYRKPNQIIHPYQFAENENDKENYVTKRTCLWTKNLPNLRTNNLPVPDLNKLFGTSPRGKAYTYVDRVNVNRAVNRSKTFKGIAHAFATQWSEYILQEEEKELKKSRKIK